MSEKLITLNEVILMKWFMHGEYCKNGTSRTNSRLQSSEPFYTKDFERKPPRPITMSKTGPCPPKDPYF